MADQHFCFYLFFCYFPHAQMQFTAKHRTKMWTVTSGLVWILQPWENIVQETQHPKRKQLIMYIILKVMKAKQRSSIQEKQDSNMKHV